MIVTDALWVFLLDGTLWSYVPDVPSCPFVDLYGDIVDMMVP